MAAKKSEAPEAFAPVEAMPIWDTTVKLGAIEEAGFAEPGDIVVAVNKSSGELTLRRAAAKSPYGRSTEGK